MKNKSVFMKLIVGLIILTICIGIGLATGMFASVGDVFMGTNINLGAILMVIVMAVSVLVLKNLIELIIKLFKPKTGRGQTIQNIVCNMLKYAAAVVIICWGLTIFGADVETIVAGVGIIALIVGFAANSVIADLVTGMFMIFENQYNVGDYIEVDGFRGRVSSIGIRTTCLEDAGGNIKIINNSDMSNILNRSDHSSRAVSVIGIPYETDLEALEKKIPDMLKGMHERHKDIFMTEPVYLGVDELADSSVNLKFVVEVEDRDIFSAQRALNRELFLCMRKEGIEVPFPQVDVHQK